MLVAITLEPSLSRTWKVRVSSLLLDSKVAVVNACRATNIRASTVDPNHPQGVRGGNYGDLRLFVDSANLADWERFLPTGAFYGESFVKILTWTRFQLAYFL